MEVPRIDYAPPIPLHRRRTVRNFAIVAITVAVIVPLVWLGGPSAWRRVQIMYWQRKALQYSPPPDEVVLDDDPSDVTMLLKQKPYTVSPYGNSAFLFARPWDRLYSLLSPPGRQPAATLFLHERRNSLGQSRLVVIDASSGAANFPTFGINLVPKTSVSLSPTVLSPQPRGRQLILPDTSVRWSIAPGPGALSMHTRWFAGQIDPQDDSHFTIRYEVEGIPHLLDGWLMDDDTVKIEDR